MAFLKKLLKVFSGSDGTVSIELLEPTKMQLRKITAIHEAAHLVMAYLSDFYFLQGAVYLVNHDVGETTVTLSKKKLGKAGKPLNPTVVQELEVALDAMRIYYAGLEAERIYCTKHGFKLDDSYSKNDLNRIDEIALDIIPSYNVSRNLVIQQTKDKVLHNWQAIEQVSEQLLASPDGITDVIDVIMFLDMGYNRNSHI